MSSTFISTAALFLALSLSPANAEPQPNGMQSGSPSAAGSPSGEQGAGARGHPASDAAQNSGASTEDSGPGKSSADEGASSAKGPKNAANEAGKNGAANETGDRNKGKSAETSATGNTSAKDTKSSDAKLKSNEANDAKTGQGNATAEGKADKLKTGEGSKDTYGDKAKMGEAGEGKGELNGKNVRIDSQEVSKVRTYFTQHRPNVQRIERNRISVSIGIGIPSDIALYDLPPDVVVVRGACPVKYFLWGEDLVLVDSCSREVVEIIGGVA